MYEYKGMSFPLIFNRNGQTTVSEGLEKVRANINLLIRQQINSLWFRPNVGVDWDSIFFADEIDITRDFIFSFVNDAIAETMDDVELRDVTVSKKESVLNVWLYFNYKVGNARFTLDYSLEGGLYE